MIVGGCFDPTNGWQAFFVDQGRFTNFKSPNSTDTLAEAINDQNVMVGEFKNAAGNWGGWWNYNGQFGLVLYPGATHTLATAINNSNIICGVAYRGDGHQFGFFVNNGAYTAFSYPGATDTACTGVSDDNKLVGYYVGTDGSYHSFVLDSGHFTPIDEPFQGASNTKINSIMPNGVSLVGQYTSESTTYGLVTGNAGWPVNPEISPLAGKSFIGKNAALLPAGSVSYAFAFDFHADGSVVFDTNIETTTNQGLCVHDDTYNYSSGSFYVQYSRLHLDNLQGQHEVTDSCNHALDRQTPIGPDGYNIEWEVGIAADGTTRLFLTNSVPSISFLDNLILVTH